MTESRDNPRYTGMFKHLDDQAGYGVWIPSGWHYTPMTGGRRGIFYAPKADDIQTSFSIEKHDLDISIRAKDIKILAKGFMDGIEALPEVEVESHEESVGKSGVILLQARFTFVEDGMRRKRWTRIVYWGTGQLTMIAQGATVADFDLYEPMFYNTMMTIEL